MQGNIKIVDQVNNYKIYSDQATYNRNKEEITTVGNSKAVDEEGSTTIEANKFIYNKIKNIVDADGNIKIVDQINKYKIYSDQATYNRNKEEITTVGNSKAIDEEGSTTIEADTFIYNKIKNIVDADGNTFIEDLIEDYKIRSEKVTYYKDFEKFVTTGETNAKIESKYTIKSKDVTFVKKDKELSSNKYSTIEDNNFQIYNLDEFVFLQIKKY